jgi:hypothetical protein
MQIFGFDLLPIILGAIVPVALGAGYKILAEVIRKVNPVKLLPVLLKNLNPAVNKLDQTIEDARKKSPELANALDEEVTEGIDILIAKLSEAKLKFKSK